MTDTSKYSSLFALVDSHLAQVSIQGNEENSNSVSPFNHFQNHNISARSSLHEQPYQLPSFGLGMGDSSIRNVLAEQVANRQKTREKDKQAEEEKRKLKLEEEMIRLKIGEEKSTTIDLTQAIQIPYRSNLLPHPKKETLSTSSSCESSLKFIFIDIKTDKVLTTAPLLPCINDISYILKKKIRKDKGSSFGKVVSSRQKRVAAPYLKEIIKTNIVPFDFSTPSPCDLIKEKQRKPMMS